MYNLGSENQNNIDERSIKMNYILGLDIGIASVGWAIVDKDSHDIIKAGVRLFDSADPTKNQERREFRGIRRNIRRRAHRLERLHEFLISNGITRPEVMSMSPVELRYKGLTETLSNEELYVALFNIAKHRGVSYLEDLEDIKDNDVLLQNLKDSKLEFPCQIQIDRLKTYNYYRGTREINSQVLINTFTIGMYENEARKILETQKLTNSNITEQFVEEFVDRLKEKREYFIGPGNDNSRTNYGVYKTSGITLDNLFDELRGKCSIYNGKDDMDSCLRASGASYSVQYYNLLNDLCNIRYNGEKLSKDKKNEVLKYIKNAKTSTKISDVLKKLYKYEKESISGFRVDRSNKEENHSFEHYRNMRTELEKVGIDISKFDIKTLDAIADVLTLNTETEAILKYFNNSERDEYQFIENLTFDEKQAFINVRRKKPKLFEKWSSYSYRALGKIVPEMIESGDEQQTCVARLKLRKYNISQVSKLDPQDVTDEIYNPVVVRSITQTIKIVNELLKDYEFADIVIELARENNDKEKVDNIKKMQKNNEELANKAMQKAGISFKDLDFTNDKMLWRR